jgi:hypothetical protein
LRGLVIGEGLELEDSLDHLHSQWTQVLQ